MPVQPITLEIIPGAIEEINEAILEISKDIMDRYMIGDNRTVTFALKMKPVIESHQGQNRNRPTLSYAIATSKPGSKSMEFKSLVRDVNGTMKVCMRTDDPCEENPDQLVIEMPVQRHYQQD